MTSGSASQRVRPLLLALLLLAGCVSPAADAPTTQAAQTGALACDPCRVVIASLGVGTREPTIVVGPDGTLTVATMMLERTAEVAGRLGIALSTSDDGGATWSTRQYAPGDALMAYDPTLVALDDGTLVLGGILLDGAYTPFGPAQGRASLFASPALGAPVVIDEGEGAEVPAAMGAAVALRAADLPAFAPGPDGLVLAAYAVRTRATPLDAMEVRAAAAVSRDGARTWTPVPLDAEGLAGRPLVMEGAWIIPVATLAGRETDECALHVTTDEGATWTRRELGACSWLPQLAAQGARLHLALPADRTVLLTSDDLGVTWSAPLALDEPDEGGEDVPMLVALADGALLATHFHALPGGDTSLRAVLVRDGTLAGRLVLEEPLWRTPFQMGERFGLAAVEGGAVATWVGEDDAGGPVVSFARLVLSPESQRASFVEAAG